MTVNARPHPPTPNPPLRRGCLIVLEGPEGVGKTTQLRRLAERLTAAGHTVVAAREPGGTPLGDEIRRILLDPASDITPRAEALLYMASRAQLVAGEIVPALQAGHMVLLDRFFLATYAYQVEGRGLPEREVREANHLAVAELVPDLTILLELPVAEGLARAAARGAADRIEGAAHDFHQRVAAAFARYATAEWQRAHPECGPIVAVDGRGTEEEVSARIAGVLAAHWPETFPLVRG